MFSSVLTAHELDHLVHSDENPVAQFIRVQCQCLNPGWRQAEDSTVFPFAPVGTGSHCWSVDNFSYFLR